MSTSPGASQSKWNKRLASGSSTLTRPNSIPGHILRPAPNGSSSKSAPLKSVHLAGGGGLEPLRPELAGVAAGPVPLVAAQRPDVH
uniref:Uncharacterized protein n=1 Tax=Arundo donax TaxID=35708 RepID=A0A0A9CFE8_ARUDO